MLHSLSEVFIVESQRCQVGASIGISLYPSDGHDVERLTKRADLAMYRAKRLGKNRIVLFDPTMDAKAYGHSSLENDLRLALVQSEFVMHYQPQVNMATGALSRASAHCCVGGGNRRRSFLPRTLFPWPKRLDSLFQLAPGPSAPRAGITLLPGNVKPGPHLRMAVNLSARAISWSAPSRDDSGNLEDTRLRPAATAELEDHRERRGAEPADATASPPCSGSRDMGVRLAKWTISAFLTHPSAISSDSPSIS